MKLLSINYFEGSPDLVKDGCCPFIISLWIDDSELPEWSSYRDEGVDAWKKYLAKYEVFPESLQRLGSSFSHKAHLGWHDRFDAIKAFERLKQFPQKYPNL